MRKSKHSERISVEQTAKRFAIGDTGKFKKEVNLWQKVIIPSVGGVFLQSAPKVTRKKGK